MPSRQREYFERKYEEHLRRAGRFRVAAGVADFLGVILGVAASLVLLALLISLLNWLAQDMNSTFTILRSRFLQ